MGRVITSGCVVKDQVDCIVSGSRVTGMQSSNVSVKIFANNNLLMNWSSASGTGVPDSSVSSGVVYFNEIPNAPGFYSIRFFPNTIGYWRVVLNFQSQSMEVSREYDITANKDVVSSNSLNASFTK